MITITTASFRLDPAAAYYVLEGYLSLPDWYYWCDIDGKTEHSNNGWDIKSTMNLSLEREDRLKNEDMEVIITWESFNAKEIDTIKIIFYKDSFLCAANNIVDDFDILSPETTVKQQNEKELYGSKIVNFIETLLPSAPTAALLMQYKKTIENIEDNYFSMLGLEQLAKRFGL